MKRNIGNADRVLRVLAAILIAALYFTNQISGPLALILGLLSVVFVLTSVVGVCPLYLLLKLSTKKSDA